MNFTFAKKRIILHLLTSLLEKLYYTLNILLENDKQSI